MKIVMPSFLGFLNIPLQLNASSILNLQPLYPNGKVGIYLQPLALLILGMLYLKYAYRK